MKGKRPLLNGIVNRIAQIGIELEGGWDAPVAGEEIIRDGSVEFVPPLPMRRQPELIQGADGQTVMVMRNVTTDAFPKYAFGEIVSQPMTVDGIEPWLRKCYPQHVNKTCGLHVHMSFAHKLNYSRLMTPDYTPFMVEALKGWARQQELKEDHPLWERLNNSNHKHCAHAFLADAQAMMKRKDYQSRGKSYSRYTFINYCAGQHNTVECRGLSMFNGPDAAISAVMCVLDSTNRFLSKIRQRERSSTVSVAEKGPVYQEISGTIR